MERLKVLSGAIRKLFSDILSLCLLKREIGNDAFLYYANSTSPILVRAVDCCETLCCFFVVFFLHLSICWFYPMVMIEPNSFYSTQNSGLCSIFYELGVGRIYICTDISSRNELKQYATAMSTFIIFIIVLTLGYVLYYAAMITIDLTAKEKSKTVTEETIDADDEDEEENEYAPRNVSEDSANGGFSISDPDTSDVEEASEEISEADEQSPEDDAHNIEANEDPSETESATSGDVEDISDIEESVEEQPSDEETPSADDAPTEDAPIDEELDGSTDTDNETPIITMVKYSEEEPAEKLEEEPFDENKAFDKTLFTPKYDVTEIVGPTVSPKILNHAIETNAAMSSIVTKANYAMDAQTFSEAMRQGSNNKYGIETTDEVQKY